MSDPNIVSRFDEIYDSTRKQVLSYITAKCGQTDDISDIFQETYMELYQVLSRRGADYVNNAAAYVMRIAKRKIARHYKLLERLRGLVYTTETNDEGEEIDVLDIVPDSFLLEEFTVNQIMVEKAWQYIKQKPQNVKKVFYLYFDVGLTISEIAKTLALTDSNVKHKLYRTLKELRDILT